MTEAATTAARPQSLRAVWQRHERPIAVAGVGLVALAVRAYGLADKPFWLDETISVNRISRDLHWVTVDSLMNSHLPTYFYLLWALTPFGMDETVLRLPAVLFGAICAALVCLIAWRIAGRAAGLAAGALMALAPFQVQMGQEARSYGMLTALILTALWGVVRLVTTPPSRGASIDWPAWSAYTLGTAGALLVLPDAVPWLVAANLGVLLWTLRPWEGRGLFLLRWGVAQLIAVLLAAPGYVAMASYPHGTMAHAFAWWTTGQLTLLHTVIAAVYDFHVTDIVSLEIFPVPIPGLGIAVGALALLGLWRLRASPRLLLVMVFAVITLPAMLMIIQAHGYKPLLLPRYFAWDAAPYFVLAGIGIAALPRRAQLGAGAVLAILCAVNLWPYYNAETRPRWDLAAADMASRLGPDDLILVADTRAGNMLGLFLKRRGPLPKAERTTDLKIALQRQASGHQVWAVYGRMGQGWMETYSGFLGRIAGLGRPAQTFAEGRQVVLLRFQGSAHP